MLSWQYWMNYPFKMKHAYFLKQPWQILVCFLNECVSSGLLQKIEHGLRCNLEWPGFGKWLSMINLLLSDKYLKNTHKNMTSFCLVLSAHQVKPSCWLISWLGSTGKQGALFKLLQPDLLFLTPYFTCFFNVNFIDACSGRAQVCDWMCEWLPFTRNS